MQYHHRRYRGFAFSTLKEKLRSSSCFSCCFGRSAGDEDDDGQRPASLIHSSSTWIRSKAQELPEVKERCLGLVSRIGRHRRHNSGEFGYDPLSYALNFDEGADEDDALAGEEFRYRNFSSRLPPSPPPPAAPAVGIACN